MIDLFYKLVIRLRGMFLRIAYTIFIGILLATFVGVGIAAFYPSPQMPKDRAYPYAEKLDTELTSEEKQEQRVQQEESRIAWEEYQEKDKNYNRDVSIISLIASVVMLGLGLTLVRKIFMISDGLLLGGVLTLIYSIIRSFNSNNNQFQFAVVSVGLAAALILGYIKFVKPHAESLKKK